MNTSDRLPERNCFDKLASLSQQGVQNGIILPCMHFHFKSIRINFITKVTRVDKAMIVANGTRLCGAIFVLFLEFRPGHRCGISHMNNDKIRPVTEPARLPGLYEEIPVKHCNFSILPLISFALEFRARNWDSLHSLLPRRSCVIGLGDWFDWREIS